MHSEETGKTEEISQTEEKATEFKTAEYLLETIKQLQSEIEDLSLERRKRRRIPSAKFGAAFLVPGILSLVFSILNNSQILAFIGLGLTFWGALFFFIAPIRYVESSLLSSTAISSYTTIDRIIKDLKYKGTSYYIPPYPKDVYLPEYLKGLKEMIVFVSADSGPSMPSIEEMAKSGFLMKNPKGICVAPPGLGLVAKFEKELRTDLTKLELNQLCESLTQLIPEVFQLAKEIEMKHQGNEVYLKIVDSLYKSLYAEESLRSVHLLGCPLTSAVACTIAKNTGKIVTIQKDNVDPEAQIVEVWYNIS